MTNQPPSLTDLYNAAKSAMLALIQRPASFVSFEGRQYAYQDMDKIRKLMADLRTQIVSMGLPDPENSTQTAESAPKKPFCSGFSIDGAIL